MSGCQLKSMPVSSRLNKVACPCSTSVKLIAVAVETGVSLQFPQVASASDAIMFDLGAGGSEEQLRRCTDRMRRFGGWPLKAEKQTRISGWMLRRAMGALQAEACQTYQAN
ncbi:hypothetical protein BDZ97DRAFT_356960 [Flammula alnicola]|nr:hypothetical protein BDZ97DRAFT_356960 [Flammula alnicola]